MRRFVGVASGTVFSFFTLTLSVWGIDDRLKMKFPQYSWVVDLLPLAAIIILLLVFALFIFEIAYGAYYKYVFTPSVIQNVTSVRCNLGDFPKIMEIASSAIGNVSSEADTIALFHRNKESFRKIVDTKTKAIIGYFCVFPLTEAGIEKVQERNLLESPVDVSLFAKRFQKGKCVYIGGVAGEGPRGRAGAREQLRLFIVNKECRIAYTRPMTKRGVSLAKEHGFKPVSEHDRLVEGVYAFKIREI